jgi:hypothetical protein
VRKSERPKCQQSPLASVRGPVEPSEAGKREAAGVAEQFRAVMAPTLSVRDQLPLEDRRPVPAPFVSFHPETFQNGRREQGHDLEQPTRARPRFTTADQSMAFF